MRGYPEELYGGKPPHVGSTSEEAANSMKQPAQSIRQRVLKFIIDTGSWGATDEEIERALKLKHQTASARRRELVLLGAIGERVEKRKTTSGRWAKTWVALREEEHE